MSPLIWDLAHVGNYEDIWLIRAIGDGAGVGPEYDGIYDAFKHLRSERPKLSLLGPEDARTYIGNVRGRVLDVLESVELDPSSRMLDHGYLYGMVIQHEHQHDETMLATLQLIEGDAPLPVGKPAPLASEIPTREAAIPGGEYLIGTDTEPWAYDNERPSHRINLTAFSIDTAPVTNAEYAAFIEAGAYGSAELWTDAGWEWRNQSGAESPLFWQRNGGGWVRRRFGVVEEVPADQPVQHVSWYEADAYARWVGRRLPTEAEWEVAASITPDGSKLRFPWGDSAPTDSLANLGQRHMSPAGVGAYPAGVSPWGCHQMIGDVWEWTSSSFSAYPGYSAFPYREYSEVFFGADYKVLRGGSWAAHPLAVRSTFRNWDFPQRRQIFSGFRTARDE